MLRATLPLWKSLCFVTFVLTWMYFPQHFYSYLGVLPTILLFILECAPHNLDLRLDNGITPIIHLHNTSTILLVLIISTVPPLPHPHPHSLLLAVAAAVTVTAVVGGTWRLSRVLASASSPSSLLEGFSIGGGSLSSGSGGGAGGGGSAYTRSAAAAVAAAEGDSPAAVIGAVAAGGTTTTTASSIRVDGGGGGGGGAYCASSTDNLAGVSFAHRLCSGPVDVVYT